MLDSGAVMGSRPFVPPVLPPRIAMQDPQPRVSRVRRVRSAPMPARRYAPNVKQANGRQQEPRHVINVSIYFLISSHLPG